ncbi:MAG: CTP synthase ura7 [Stictis urceolatum]|nr:CTP synthase ura7 [Stictis urceolata]
MAWNRKLDIVWINAEHLESQPQNDNLVKFDEAWRELGTAQGVLVPSGFGQRGTEGMIAAAKWARMEPTPNLGVCLGMQIAVIEYTRDGCGIAAACSEELDGAGAESKVIVKMPEIDPDNLGSTMRLGLKPTYFQIGREWSRTRKL